MLLHKLDTTDYSCLVLPRTLTSRLALVPTFHSCQVRTASAALFCLYSTVVFTGQPRALQLFSAAVSPHTERCAGWLATSVAPGRSAHSGAPKVASLNNSSHGSQSNDWCLRESSCSACNNSQSRLFSTSAITVQASFSLFLSADPLRQGCKMNWPAQTKDSIIVDRDRSCTALACQ